MLSDKDEKIVIRWLEEMVLKNALVIESNEALCENADDFEYYQYFIQICFHLLNDDSAFFLLDSSFSSKVLDVIDRHRFSFSDMDSSCFERSNDIIAKINQLSHLSPDDKSSLLLNYALKQYEYRLGSFSLKDLITVNANDYLIYSGMESGLQFFSDEETLSSLSYFASTCPECYYDNIFYSNAIQFIEEFCDVPFYKKRGVSYKMATNVKKKLQKVRGA